VNIKTAQRRFAPEVANITGIGGQLRRNPHYVAYSSPLEHQELVLTLNEAARIKILAKTRRLRRNRTKHPRSRLTGIRLSFTTQE
jgi:hypothetical protein